MVKSVTRRTQKREIWKEIQKTTRHLIGAKTAVDKLLVEAGSNDAVSEALHGQEWSNSPNDSAVLTNVSAALVQAIAFLAIGLKPEQNEDQETVTSD